MILDMSGALDFATQPAILQRRTQSIVNFKPHVTITETTIQAVIQPADKEKLQKDKYDFSSEILQVHSVSQIQINDILIYKTKKYLAKELNNCVDYGYYEAIFEEQKTS